MDCTYILDSPLTEGMLGVVIGAILGSLISGWFILKQTRTSLDAERSRRQEERESETKSLAAALLWEIDDFSELSVRDVCRALKNIEPSTLGFHAKSATYKGFVVFEANADKIGLFGPTLIQTIIFYYGVARAYLNTVSDYGQAIRDYEGGMQTHVRAKAVSLLSQVKEGSAGIAIPRKTVCEMLAERAGTPYVFEVP